MDKYAGISVKSSTLYLTRLEYKSVAAIIKCLWSR